MMNSLRNCDKILTKIVKKSNTKCHVNNVFDSLKVMFLMII